MRFIGAKMAYLVSIMRLGFITMLLLVVGRVSAQNDTIFPNVDGTWDMTTTTWDWDGQNMNFMYFNYTLQYYAEPSVEIDGLSWGSVTSGDGTQIGLLAVDQDKVFYRSIQPFYYGYEYYGDTATQVLYDFGLSVNDTAYWQSSDPSFPVTVQSIDTVWLAGRARKRLHLNVFGDEWVAGIGSIKGLLTPLQFWFEASYSMSNFCGNYLDADSVPYQACLPFTVGVPDAPKAKLAIHPNPSTGTFVVEGASPNKPYHLTDVRGIEVLSGLTAAGSTNILLPHAIPGFYVLNVAGTRTKVIVQ